MVFFRSLFLFATFFLFACAEAPGKQSSNFVKTGDTVAVSEQHKSCSEVSDCGLFYNSCDGCTCGNAMNLAFISAYNRELDKICPDDDGTTVECSVECPEIEMRCSQNRCIAQAIPDSL